MPLAGNIQPGSVSNRTARHSSLTIITIALVFYMLISMTTAVAWWLTASDRTYTSRA